MICTDTYIQYPLTNRWYMMWSGRLPSPGAWHSNFLHFLPAVHFKLFQCMLPVALVPCLIHSKYMLIWLTFLSSCLYRVACEKLEIILTSGVIKIDQLVHECFSLVEAGRDSPVWSSCLHQIDASILCGLKNAFMSAIGSLLRRVELYEQVSVNSSLLHCYWGDAKLLCMCE